jgi:hypothetical protein
MARSSLLACGIFLFFTTAAAAVDAPTYFGALGADGAITLTNKVTGHIYRLVPRSDGGFNMTTRKGTTVFVMEPQSTEGEPTWRLMNTTGGSAVAFGYAVKRRNLVTFYRVFRRLDTATRQLVEVTTEFASVKILAGGTLEWRDVP